MADLKRGNRIQGIEVPRIFTPPLRELTPETSDGFAAIAFAETMLGMVLFPWQKWLLIHALEIDAATGTYRFRVVIVEVARQNGKTMVEIILALWHMYALKSPEIIGTAQSLEKAEDAWKEAVALAQSDIELAELIPDDGIFLGHPKQFVVLHDDARCEYRIAAATRRGGRGFSADLILLDELREHTNWDSWASVTNTMNARPLAQSWAFSNAGDVVSVVLRYQRALAHKVLGWPDGDEDVQNEILMDVTESSDDDFEELELDDDEKPFETGYFEWSMPPGVKRNNPTGLAQANPSMNHVEVTPNCITLRALLHGVYNSPAHVVETEICCRWPTMGLGGPFVEGSWESTLSADARPEVGSKNVVCVEVSSKRTQTYIARAGLDGSRAVVGIWEDRTGTDWVLEWLVAHQDSIDAVVIRAVSGAPVMSLYDDIVAAELPVVDWKGSDISSATGKMFDRLRDNDIAHLPHGGLDMAATSATSVLQPQGGWVIDIKKSPTDVAPLLAAIGATWGLEHVPERVSMYATQDVMVIR